MTTKVDQPEPRQVGEGSKPIEIPSSGGKDEAAGGEHGHPNKNAHLMRFLEEENKSHHEESKENKKTASGSPQEHGSDDEFRLPQGSPSFTTVMNELSENLSRHVVHHNPHHHEEMPISPLALSGSHGDPFSSENISPKSKSPPVPEESPTMRKKRLGSASRNTTPRNRSYSWNHRNKMAAERRKQLSLAVPHHNEPSSTSSSPLILRKQKTKSQPSTPQLVHVFPKYKFVTETISVSHDDLVKEQERERHMADGFAEVTSKSIFANPLFDRLSNSPEH